MENLNVLKRDCEFTVEFLTFKSVDEREDVNDYEEEEGAKDSNGKHNNN